jgi:hypothetical protein
MVRVIDMIESEFFFRKQRFEVQQAKASQENST